MTEAVVSKRIQPLKGGRTETCVLIHFFNEKGDMRSPPVELIPPVLLTPEFN